MKIAIVAPSPVPFLIGGAEKFMCGLHAALNQLTPHDAELIKVPCRDQEFWTLMEGYERFHRMDLNYFDLVISTKYPAWMVSHPAHVVYMQHACRGVYDLYHLCGKSTIPPRHKNLEELFAFIDDPKPGKHLLAPFLQTLFALRDRADLPRSAFLFPGPLTRAVIHFLDRVALAKENVRRYFAISKNVVNRDGYFPEGARVEVVNHPTDLKGLYARDYDYVFTASRLEDLKRVDVLIKAFKKVKTDLRFKIAGTGGQEARFRDMAADDERIEFLGYVSDEELVDLYAGALFVPFIPYDEDYGLITLEAMLSGKAVLTTRDAGGVIELIRHGKSGLISDPNPDALAESMAELIQNRDETIRMGKVAREDARHITWKNTVAHLFGDETASLGKGVSLASRLDRRTNRKKVVMVNDYPVIPPVGGGQKRIYHVCRNLAASAEVALLTMTPSENGRFRHVIAECATEFRFPKTQAQKMEDRRLANELRTSVDDISAIASWKLNPGYLEFLKDLLKDADLVICAHPYLYRAVRHVWNGPVWLDAHNVEADMKAMMLPDSRNCDEVLAQVTALEKSCVQDAQLVSCVSEADRQRLHELYGSLANVLVVPNGMDFGAAPFRHSDGRKVFRDRLGVSVPVALFIGSDHVPNNDALDKIRMIADQCPQIAFFIVGSVCNSLAGKKIPDNMRLLGVLSEEEKAVVLHVANVALNPVCQGGGTNLKTIEYIAWRIPVLSTPCGVRGFDFEEGRHLWIRETTEFPEALREMVSAAKEAEMAEMAENAYMQARFRYDWQVACEPLVKQIANFNRDRKA